MPQVFVMDIDAHDPSEWATHNVKREARTMSEAATQFADAMNRDPRAGLYHIAVGAREDGADAREYIVKSEIVRTFTVQASPKPIGRLITG